MIEIDLKLVKKDVQWDEAEYIYEYKGYVIKEYYFHEEDCDHHSAHVYFNNKELKQFNWAGCLQQAIKYIDELISKGDQK